MSSSSRARLLRLLLRMSTTLATAESRAACDRCCCCSDVVAVVAAADRRRGAPINGSILLAGRHCCDTSRGLRKNEGGFKSSRDYADEIPCLIDLVASGDGELYRAGVDRLFFFQCGIIISAMVKLYTYSDVVNIL